MDKDSTLPKLQAGPVPQSMNLPNYSSYCLLPGKILAILAADFLEVGQRASECGVLGSRGLPPFLTVYPG